jgi:hypothetical protein
MHPRAIAEVMVDKACKSLFALTTDYTSFDATMSKLHQQLYSMCLHRAFARCYHMELTSLLAKERNATAFTSRGIRYNAGESTLSGSSSTSDRNSIANAFNSYVAYRRTLDAHAAWAALGLYGGDDGVSYDLPPKNLSVVVSRLGMTIKCEALSAHSHVPFLGRLYCDPWVNGDSVAEVRRQLSKLHLSMSPGHVPMKVALYRKAYGLLACDPRTPLLTPLCQLIVRKLRTELTEEIIEKYAVACEVDKPYLSSVTDAYSAPVDVVLAYRVVADNMELTIGELFDLEQRVVKINTLCRLKRMLPLLRVERPTMLDVVHRGSVKLADKQPRTMSKGRGGAS